MISTDFAPNEELDDAILSTKLIFQPWRWYQGDEKNRVTKELFEFLRLPIVNKGKIHFFLTGRFALYHLLKSLNLKKESEIIVPAFTCEAVVLPILALGLKVVFVDIEKNSYSIDYDKLKPLISKNTACLLIQHSFGFRPIDQDKIIDLAVKNNLAVIEDLSHGFFSYQIPKAIKNKIGKTNLNYFLLLSFGRTKSVSSVFGGAIVSFNDEINKKLDNLKKQIPQLSYSQLIKLLIYKPIVFTIKKSYSFLNLGKLLHFLIKKTHLLSEEITKKEKKGQLDFSLDYHYPNVLAILLLNQFKKIKTINLNRQKITLFYQKAFSNGTPFLSKYYAQFFPIRFPLLVDNPDKIRQKLAKKNIFLGNWYSQIVAPKEFPLRITGYQKNSCPQAEKICQSIINLPTNISRKQAELIVKLIKSTNQNP